MSLHIWYSESDWPKPSINMEIDVPSNTTVDELKEIFRKKIPSVPRASTEFQATYFTQVRANTTQEHKQFLGWTFATNGTPTYDGSVPLSDYTFWNTKGTTISFSIGPGLPKEYYAEKPAKKATHYGSTYEDETQYATNSEEDEEDDKNSFPYEPAREAPGAGAGTKSSRRHRQAPAATPATENSNEEKCRKFLKSKGIESLVDFRKKSLQLHPNKGGDVEEYQKISGCVDTVFKRKNGGARKSRRSRTKKHRKQKTRKQ